MAVGTGSFVLFNMLSTAFMAHPNAGTATTTITSMSAAAAASSTISVAATV
jgi:hypothetical protein